MNKTAAASLIALSTLLVAPLASAQQSCAGWLCAEFHAGVNIGVQTQPPPPPPPQPPVLVEQPVVVYQQPVYVQQQRVVVTTTPTYYQNTTTYWNPLQRGQQFGIGAFVGGLTTGSASGRSGRDGVHGAMGGIGGVMRFRSHPFMATELSLGAYGGSDYNGDLRAEIPLSLSELFYLNPSNRFQVYGLVGVGGSWASVSYRDGNNASHGGRDFDQYGYVGGQLGAGFEWQLSQNFSLFTDVRGFLRTRIDGHTQENPEFSRVVDGRTQTTNTSVGAVFQGGALWYF